MQLTLSVVVFSSPPLFFNREEGSGELCARALFNVFLGVKPNCAFGRTASASGGDGYTFDTTETSPQISHERNVIDKRRTFSLSLCKMRKRDDQTDDRSFAVLEKK